MYKERHRRKERVTFDLAFELAKSLTYPFIEQRRINGLGKSFNTENWLCFQPAIDTPTVCKIERRFSFSSYSRMCFMCAEKSNTKKEKDNASSSKENCQSCGKSVCRKHALHIYECCNNSWS